MNRKRITRQIEKDKQREYIDVKRGREEKGKRNRLT